MVHIKREQITETIIPKTRLVQLISKANICKWLTRMLVSQGITKPTKNGFNGIESFSP